MYRAYFDASCGAKGECSSIGWVIYHRNKVIKEFSKTMRYIRSSTRLEFLALLSLMNGLIREGIEDVVIFGDNSNVIDYASEKVPVKKHHRKLFKINVEVQITKKAVPGVIFMWTSRRNNTHAHRLSREALNEKENHHEKVCTRNHFRSHSKSCSVNQTSKGSVQRTVQRNRREDKSK